MNTQEQKELLLKDLCARLPYGVKVQDELGRIHKLVIGNADLGRLYYNDFSTYSEEKLSLPYLFPLSSITEEQTEKLKGLCNMFNPDYYYPYAYWGIGVLYRHIHDDNYKLDFKTDVIDWFHKNHIDYRGLIPMGLAIDATGLNIY